MQSAVAVIGKIIAEKHHSPSIIFIPIAPILKSLVIILGYML